MFERDFEDHFLAKPKLINSKDLNLDEEFVAILTLNSHEIILEDQVREVLSDWEDNYFKIIRIHKELDVKWNNLS